MKIDGSYRRDVGCRGYNIITCVKCRVPNVFTYLTERQRQEIIILLWCLNKGKTILPCRRDLSNMRRILKPEFIVMTQYLLERVKKSVTKQTTTLTMLQLYDFVLADKQLVLKCDWLLACPQKKCDWLLACLQKKCIELAEIRNLWFDSHYKSLFNQELSNDVNYFKIMNLKYIKII